ncbi:peptidase inhibitor family I36 protein [Streptomyces sp. UH6]|uniref:peptidase inhibitor family I36 protein n=1 Tax=Streptomyces sp. UH6 TaxID=2748379 RepID=UPI0015D4ADEA|nr:peptidase inhibitor family I36 protein [Streptomyces sp. UH6]NYV73033.1 peptidase inhibitor family I36 protein [Streptomyces sp. UH6]
MKHRRTVLAPVLAALAAGALVAPSSAATAQPSTPGSRAAAFGCPEGFVCLWEHANGKGKVYRFQWGATDLDDLGFDNTASSWSNNRRKEKAWCLYPEAHYRGTPLRLGSGKSGNFAAARDDWASSVGPC